MYCGAPIPEKLLLSEEEKVLTYEQQELNRKDIEEDYKKIAATKSQPKSFWDRGDTGGYSSGDGGSD